MSTQVPTASEAEALSGRRRIDPRGAGVDRVTEEPPPPLLRGWLHVVGFFASLPAGVLVVSSTTSTRARVAAIIYAVALSALFGVSALYHRWRWTDAGRQRMKRADHGTIFVMIAACYTPLCLLALQGPWGIAMLLIAWTGAAIGLGFAVTGIAEKPVFGLACYIGLGWVLVAALPELTRQLSGSALALLIVGGVAYTVGGIVLGTNWPNPHPGIFGYHEVWHLLVLIAAVCHYLTIYSVVVA